MNDKRESDRDRDEQGKKRSRPVPGLGQPALVKAESGRERKQYPPKPGYHGSDEEKALNPEE